LPTTSTLNSLTPATLVHGQPITFNVTVKPQSGSGIPNGQVALLTGLNSGKGIADFTLANGTASGTTDLLPGGTYSVSAHYSGDGTYGASDSNAIPVNVTPESSKTFANLVTFDVNGKLTSFNGSNATYGWGYFLLRMDVGDSAASVSSSTGISSNCSHGIASCPTGTIGLTANGSPLMGGTLPLNSEGFAEDQSLAPGSYAVSANYLGDSSYGSSLGTTNFRIAKAPTTAIAAVAGLPVEYGNSQQIAAGLGTTSNGGAPTGAFVFFVDGSAATGSIPVRASGAYNPKMSPPHAWANASSSMVFLNLGKHDLSVEYSGDANYAPATSAPSSFMVTQARPFFNSYGASPSTANMNQQVTLRAQLFGSGSGVAPTGTITFLDGNSALSGSVNYTGKDGNGNVGGSTLIATMPYTFSTPGTHILTMSYSGDTNYKSAAAFPPATLTVLGPFSITPSGGVNISGSGQSGRTTLTVSPNNGFTGPVNLSCKPDPNAKESSCSFTNGVSTGTTVQVNLNGSSATVTLNITTTAPHPQAALLVPILGGPAGPVLGALVVLFMPIIHRRRRIVPTFCALALALSLAGCGGGGATGTGGSGTAGSGGGNTDPGTAAGTYTFTVVGASGSGSETISIPTPVAVSIR
jgi:hypothetical protein